MSTRYKNVVRRSRGFLRDNGKHRSCMRNNCSKRATVQAVRRHGLWLQVHYCGDHAQQAGLL